VDEKGTRKGWDQRGRMSRASTVASWCEFLSTFLAGADMDRTSKGNPPPRPDRVFFQDNGCRSRIMIKPPCGSRRVCREKIKGGSFLFGEKELVLSMEPLQAQSTLTQRYACIVNSFLSLLQQRVRFSVMICRT
jgi:hypothetical protein